MPIAMLTHSIKGTSLFDYRPDARITTIRREFKFYDRS